MSNRRRVKNGFILFAIALVIYSAPLAYNALVTPSLISPRSRKPSAFNA